MRYNISTTVTIAKCFILQPLFFLLGITWLLPSLILLCYLMIFTYSGCNYILAEFFNGNVIYRKEPSRAVLKKRFLKICSNFKGENPCWSVISIKLLCNIIEITLQHGCSPLNLLHIFRTSFSKNTSGDCALSILKTFPFL